MQSLGSILVVACGGLMMPTFYWMVSAQHVDARCVMAILALLFTAGAALGAMLLGGWFLALAILAIVLYVVRLIHVFEKGLL